MLSSALIRIVNPFNSKSLWDGRVTRGHGWLLSRKGSSWCTRRLTVTSNRPIKDFHSGTRAAHTGTSPTGVWIEATPRVCLHDVPTILRAGGLPPNSPVTLHAHLIDENGKQFCSNAHYLADAKGEVDVSKSSSIGGSYTGVFPAGLLTTLAPAPHEFPLLRLYRRDPSTPWKICIRMLKGQESLETNSEALAEVELERHLMSPGVQRIPVRDGRVRATLFLPPGEGPFPGVIDMFGTAGGLMEFKAAMLASRGIAALALAYFAFEDLPKTTDHFELEYFEEAVDILLSYPGIVPDRCGVVAVSKAADIAFTMATWLPKVKAVVSINGSPVAFDSHITYQGRTLVEGVKMGLQNLVIDEHGRIYPRREQIMEDLKPHHPKYIPFNLADDETYFLMVGGGSDAWSCDLPVSVTQQRMESFGREQYLQGIVYPGAGHILEPPYGPLIYQSYHRHLPVVAEDQTKVTGVPMLWGGNAFDTCIAQEDLWPRMREFIVKHVLEESPWYQQHVAACIKEHRQDGGHLDG